MLRRLAGALLLLWLVLTITFALIRLAPGDAATFLVSPSATAADVARTRAELGLDRSIAVQYARWAVGMLRGDLGESFSLHQPVTQALAQALPVSVGLGAASLFLTFLVGVPVGMLQAIRRGRPLDHVLTVLTTVVYAAPSFWLALAFVAVFTYGAAAWGFPQWMRLPAFGLRSPGADLHGVAAVSDLLRHALLPVTILAAVGAAGIARYARSSVTDVLSQDFVRTARAKGMSPARVYFRHVLMTVLPSFVVLFALSLPGLVAGSIFVEAVFAWPGMGRLMVNAIIARDYPLVMGAAGVYAALVLAANLAGDLVLPLIDPRRRA
ncbi:MAG: ABC-type transporter, integral rane subunit [Gemmatimonadetes bacterium]|nr:ABC-type transporter, integral rane subunit [Gemmatimonadota bacterium]